MWSREKTTIAIKYSLQNDPRSSQTEAPVRRKEGAKPDGGQMGIFRQNIFPCVKHFRKTFFPLLISIHLCASFIQQSMYIQREAQSA